MLSWRLKKQNSPKVLERRGGLDFEMELPLLCQPVEDLEEDERSKHGKDANVQLLTEDGEREARVDDSKLDLFAQILDFTQSERAEEEPFDTLSQDEREHEDRVDQDHNRHLGRCQKHHSWKELHASVPRVHEQRGSEGKGRGRIGCEAPHDRVDSKRREATERPRLLGPLFSSALPHPAARRCSLLPTIYL